MQDARENRLRTDANSIVHMSEREDGVQHGQIRRRIHQKQAAWPERPEQDSAEGRPKQR
jgi:hypothetical protein